jgi:hypothetical protein
LLLPATLAKLLFAGDFNCIIKSTDSTGNVPCSKALEKMVKGLRLHCVWDVLKGRHGFTHYAPISATRHDRNYVTENLYTRKRGVETVASAFRTISLLSNGWQQMCLFWSEGTATGK